MPRIPYPDPAGQSDELRDKLTRLGSLNVTRMISHSEGALAAYSRLGTFLLGKGTLDPVTRETAILRVGQLCGSDYEWHQHESVARAIGMDEKTLDAIRHERFDELDGERRLAVDMAEEIRRDGGAGEATVARATTLLTSEQLVELVLCVGYYIMTAGLLLSLDIEIEDGPPLGEAMRAEA